MGFEDAQAEFREVVAASVERHLMADVEVAAYLSSGFDSTTVAALAARSVSGHVATFTGTFGEKGWYDEGTGARVVAETIGSRHHEIPLSGDNLPTDVDAVAASLDEPRMGLGALPQYLVARAVSRSHKVILTGHGGDELFAGYPHFRLSQLAHGCHQPLVMMRRLAGVRFSEIPHLAYFLGRSFSPGGRALLPLPLLFRPGMLRKLLRRGVADVLLDIDPAIEGRDLLEGETDSYRRLTLSYLRLYLPGLFVVEDRISMAHSLESRTPLCDNSVLDLALSLSVAVKLHGGVLKAVPKAAMRGALPDVLWQMPKRGFPTPLASWLRGPHRAWLQRRLIGEDSPLHTLFRPHALARLVSRYLHSPNRYVRPLDEIPTHRMWILLILDACMRRRGLTWS
ncbi:asparagine synthetase B family protein [Candidatus Latescibacterota bacterium]